MDAAVWFKRIKCLVLVCIFASIGNFISTSKAGKPVIADYAIEQIGKIGLLPLCTPILAYAGISIGKDVDTFKEQGLAIVIVAIFTFAGTFLGSTIIAQIILKMTGVI